MYLVDDKKVNIKQVYDLTIMHGGICRYGHTVFPEITEKVWRNAKDVTELFVEYTHNGYAFETGELVFEKRDRSSEAF